MLPRDAELIFFSAVETTNPNTRTTTDSAPGRWCSVAPFSWALSGISCLLFVCCTSTEVLVIIACTIARDVRRCYNCQHSRGASGLDYKKDFVRPVFLAVIRPFLCRSAKKQRRGVSYIEVMTAGYIYNYHPRSRASSIYSESWFPTRAVMQKRIHDFCAHPVLHRMLDSPRGMVWQVGRSSTDPASNSPQSGNCNRCSCRGPSSCPWKTAISLMHSSSDRNAKIAYG